MYGKEWEVSHMDSDPSVYIVAKFINLVMPRVCLKKICAITVLMQIGDAYTPDTVRIELHKL